MSKVADALDEAGITCLKLLLSNAASTLKVMLFRLKIQTTASFLAWTQSTRKYYVSLGLGAPSVSHFAQKLHK